MTILAFSANVLHGTLIQGPYSYPRKISPDYPEICIMRTSVRGKRYMDFWLWNTSSRTDPCPLHRYKICIKILSKWSFFDQNQQPLNDVETFERILRALFISHNARTNSLLFSTLKLLLTGSDWFHVISDCVNCFFRDLHGSMLFEIGPPPEICQVE